MLGHTARTHETGETMTKLADLKKRLMANPEFQKEYAAADAEFSFFDAQVQARVKADEAQSKVGCIGTTRSPLSD